MLVTVPERRRMIEAMRRRGTTRTMTVQALMFDALVIGALAMRARPAAGRAPVDRGVPRAARLSGVRVSRRLAAGRDVADGGPGGRRRPAGGARRRARTAARHPRPSVALPARGRAHASSLERVSDHRRDGLPGDHDADPALPAAGCRRRQLHVGDRAAGVVALPVRCDRRRFRQGSGSLPRRPAPCSRSPSCGTR